MNKHKSICTLVSDDIDYLLMHIAMQKGSIFFTILGSVVAPYRLVDEETYSIGLQMFNFLYHDEGF